VLGGGSRIVSFARTGPVIVRKRKGGKKGEHEFVASCKLTGKRKGGGGKRGKGNPSETQGRKPYQGGSDWIGPILNKPISEKRKGGRGERGKRKGPLGWQ